MIDTLPYLDRFRITPFEHQVEGVQRLANSPAFLLADEMGAGKTKQAIDASQVLFMEKEVRRVIVLAPNAVCGVWFDKELGELAKHLWSTVPTRVTRFHNVMRLWYWGQEPQRFEGKKPGDFMQWTIANYDYVRREEHLPKLLKACTPDTLLILDESSAIKNWKAVQTEAAMALREHCGRVWLLNGTPIANSPADLFSQAEIMDPDIFGCSNFFHYRARYAIMGGFKGRQVVGWQDIDDIQRRMAPYVLRRLKKDCLDLPEKLEPVSLEVPLKESTWKHYKSMRDELCSWLNDHAVATAAQAIVKVLRLAQITSGFVGGIETLSLDDMDPGAPRPDWLPLSSSVPEPDISSSDIRWLGTEKLDFFLQWLNERLEEDRDFRVVTWCRFQAELHRAVEWTRKKHKFPVDAIVGGQKKEERAAGERLFHPDGGLVGPGVLFGTKSAGGVGKNFTAAHTILTMSDDFSLFYKLQSDDRIHRIGQTHAVSYFNLLATGPKGQKTIDHTIAIANQRKLDVATMTTSAWVSVLQEE